MDLLAQGKSMMKELMDVTGSLEGINHLMDGFKDSNVGYINENNRILMLNAVVSQERAKAINDFASKIVEEEKREYENKLKSILGTKNEEVVEKEQTVAPRARKVSPKAKEVKAVEVPEENPLKKLESMKKMLSENKTYTEIGLEFGMTKKQVHDFLEKFNVSAKQYCP